MSAINAVTSPGPTLYTFGVRRSSSASNDSWTLRCTAMPRRLGDIRGGYCRSERNQGKRITSCLLFREEVYHPPAPARNAFADATEVVRKALLNCCSTGRQRLRIQFVQGDAFAHQHGHLALESGRGWVAGHCIV